MFVRPLYFSLACLVMIPFYISGIVRQNPHLGSYLKSAATVVSAFIFGATGGGIVVSGNFLLYSR